MKCEERLGRAVSVLHVKKSLRFVSISTMRLYQYHCISKMCSSQKARDALLVAYNSALTDDEFVRCCLKNPELPHQDYSRFCLEDVDEDECVVNFRFKKNEIPVLGHAMGLHERLTCQQELLVNKLKCCVYFFGKSVDLFIW